MDTASHYMDGTAESAVSQALKLCDSKVAERIEVISKFGYIQGSTLERVKNEGDYPQTVHFSDQVRHCMHLV